MVRSGLRPLSLKGAFMLAFVGVVVGVVVVASFVG